MLLLIPVLVLGCVLRFDGLQKRGLLYWDEGKFSLEGLRLEGLVHSAFGNHAAVLTGKAIGTAKPTHALLIALSFALFGAHDYAPLLLDSFASILEIAAVYVVGRRLFGGRVGILAAAFLAVSAYDITYARSALSESDANLMFLLGVLVWIPGWNRLDRTLWMPRGSLWRYRIPAALLFGIGFTANYRLVVYITILVSMDLLVLLLVANWRAAIRALIYWSAGLVVLPLAWQVIGVVAASHGTPLFRSEITYRSVSYFSEVLYQLHGGKQSVLKFEPGLYVQWYVVRQGWPSFLLLITGLGLALSGRSLRWIVPATLVLLPYVLYTFAPFVVPRNLDAAIAFASLISAAALVALVDRIRRFRYKTIVLTGGALALLAVGSFNSFQLTVERSGFLRATQYLRAHGNESALVTNEVMVFYLRDRGLGCDALRLPDSLQSLSVAGSHGYKYAVVDGYSTPLERYLRSNGHVIASFVVYGSPPMGENPIASENGYGPGEKVGQKVTIYSLSGLQLPPSHRASTVSCSVDRLA